MLIDKAIDLANSGLISNKHSLDECYLKTFMPAPKPLKIKLL